MEPSRRHLVLFRDDHAGRDVLFARPSDILAPNEPEAFFPAIAAAQSAHEAGKWLAGYISYEAGYLLEPRLNGLMPRGRRAPLFCLGVFEAPSDAPIPVPCAQQAEPVLTDPRPDWTFADYLPRFERLHEHLHAGDCYQANLTFPVRMQWAGDPLTMFERLTRRQPVGYGAFVDLAGPTILSRSPELFFRIGQGRWIETAPMKGTMARGLTPRQDERARTFLENDPKNQAENRMIVDLLRNDMSLISEVGTLQVTELFKIETYPTLHQMVSRIRARLRPDLTIGGIFGALFPCGSITGAPKIRAMEILRGLEQVPRDVYCGAIGWIAPSGHMRFSVAIRTIALYPRGEAVLNVGGGIVFDSTAEEEYAECLLKARFAVEQVPASV